MTMTSNQQMYLSSASHIFTKSGSYITDINSLGRYNGDEVQRNSRHTEIRTKTFDSDEENPHHLPEPSALSNNGLGSRRNSRKPSTNGTVTQEIQAHTNVEKQPDRLKFSQMSHRSKYTLIMLAVANFGAGCAFSLPAPFFPREAAKKGASSTIIGLVFSCFQLVTFASSPLFGNFITNIGAKFTYVSGIMTAGSCAILFGFLDKGPSGTSFIVMSFLVRSVEAVGVAAFSTASFAIISNEFPNHIGSVFATLETCVGIGLMVGPTMGAALYEVGGFGLPFWIIGAIICCSGLTIMTCLPEPQDKKKPSKGSVLSLLKSMIVWVACFSIFTGACGIAFLDPTLSVHLDEFGLSTLQVGLFFIIAPGLYAALAPLWGFISDRKDIQSPLLIIGNLVCAIAFLFIGPTPLIPFLPRELSIVTIGLVMFGLTLGCSIVPTMKCLVIGARELGFPDDLSTFGMVSGLFNATFYLGAFFGPTIGGALVEKIGFAYGSTIISGFYFFVLIVTSVFFGVRKFQRKSALENKTTTPALHQTPKLFEESEITDKTPLILEKAPKRARLTFDSLSASFSHR